MIKRYTKMSGKEKYYLHVIKGHIDKASDQFLVLCYGRIKDELRKRKIAREKENDS